MTNSWTTLNDRQRAYLQALYDCDQAAEALRRDRASRGFYDRTPASEWRWVMYGPTEPPSELYRILHATKLVDKGTGATWRALETRGLIMCREKAGAFGVLLLQVQITPAGRKAVRSAIGVQRPKTPPKGQLRERQWAALTRLYAAGDAGELYDAMIRSFDWTRTLLRLRDYKPQALMEEFSQGSKYYMRLTSFGREYYQHEWARYRELYPEVDAPQPDDEDRPISEASNASL